MTIIKQFNEVETDVIVASQSETYVGYNNTTNLIAGQILKVKGKGDKPTDIKLYSTAGEIHCPMYYRFRHPYKNELKGLV